MRDTRPTPKMELNPWPRIRLASLWRIPSGRSITYDLRSHHLLLIAHGRMDVRNLGRETSAQPGDLLCLAPTAGNSLRIPETVTYHELYVFFEPEAEWNRRSGEEQRAFLPLRTRLGDEYADIRSRFERICLQLRRGGVADRLESQAHLLHILADLARNSGEKEPIASPRVDDWARVKAFLEARVPECPSIASLAAELGISTEHFIRKFRQRFGLPPKAYRQYSRVLWAAERLRNSDEPIKAIAWRTGFPSPQALTRAFRHWLSTSPSAYRNSGGAVVRSADPLPTVEGGLQLNRHVSPPEAENDPLPIRHHSVDAPTRVAKSP